MFKKITAYSFLILANIALLAHAVIPHHHHHQHVCIENTHNLGDESEHSHDSPEHNHQHDGTNSDNCCFLSQAVVITPVQSKLSHSCERYSDNHHHGFTIISDFEVDNFHSILIATSSIPEISFNITSYITQTIGLRAPPVV
ncbi:MAG: hypothetical protein K9G70_07490 [Prolixibacteraceae bacterium]|nr:hypothetical protein [Prolixibacteraceae bacterium]